MGTGMSTLAVNGKRFPERELAATSGAEAKRQRGPSDAS